MTSPTFTTSVKVKKCIQDTVTKLYDNLLTFTDILMTRPNTVGGQEK